MDNYYDIGMLLTYGSDWKNKINLNDLKDIKMIEKGLKYVSENLKEIIDYNNVEILKKIENLKLNLEEQIKEEELNNLMEEFYSSGEEKRLNRYDNKSTSNNILQK